MTFELKKISSKLKPYHIIIMSCLLATLMIINSNNVNKDRALMKENIEKDGLFRKIIGGRLLSERNLEVNNHENSEKVCSKGSDDLIDYYKTGDPSKIGLDDDDIKCEDKDSDYMKALIDLVRNNIGDNKKNTDTPENLRMIEEESSDDKDNIIKYGMRILPMVIFLVIGVFSIFGWIACCICNCCDCCCCCCCKKKTCKIPCFIFTFLFYGLVVAVCLYGLTQSNKIFTGLANVECSLLKLLEQVVDGEIKQTTPRWIGISGINDLLGNLKDQIVRLKDNALTNLDTEQGKIDPKKDSFLSAMNKFDTDCYAGGDYLAGYTTAFDADNYISADYKTKKYVFDIIKYVGHKESGETEYPCPSFLYFLNREYSGVVSKTDGFIATSKSSFENILGVKSGKVISALDKAEESLNKLKKPFDKINNKIGDKVSDYSDLIDKYGKLVVKLVFSILMVMNIALAVFLTFIGLCSMKSCADCCFCRCLFKSGLHILWNILALMMILAFLVGSILAIVGRVGADAMSLVSFILSEENFENTQDIFCPKQGIGETQSSYMNCHITQNPFNLPKNFYDNFSSFSGNSNSTNASISQMTSLYMANQRKKAFTDEINLCLNKSLEKILPMVAKRTAELIYSSISQILIDNEKNLRELRNSFDTLRATLQSCNFLLKKSNDMKNIQNVYGNLNKVNEKLNNCGILLNNQIKFAQGNEEFKNQQQELLNKIMGKFEYIKGILAKQKDFSGKLNECIKNGKI